MSYTYTQKTEFVIRGGKPAHGTVRVSGNKNAVLPMIAASLLTREKVILHNVPDIIDVHQMCSLAESFGVQTHFEGDTLSLYAENIHSSEMSRQFCSATRTSILFVGPLLARKGSVSFYSPGGDVIGRRRIDTHLYGLQKLGAVIDVKELPYKLHAILPLTGDDLFFDEASVTATEHIMITAALAQGTTTLMNAAAEPHIQDLGEMLNAMGARISGLGTNTITIEGVSELHGCEFHVSGDYIEGGSYLILAAATRGDITVQGIRPRHFWMFRRVFERFGITLEFSSDSVTLPPGQHCKIAPDFGNAIPVISDGPWPQYPSDMMSCSIVLATQSEGTLLFFEKMYESRIYFVDRLISMGANAIVCDPHRVVISGPAKLHPARITSPDIRAGMAMVIAALCAEGESVICDAAIVARGYANLPEKLTALGCSIRVRN